MPTPDDDLSSSMARFAELEGDYVVEASRPPMTRVSGVYLRTEDAASLEDVSGEVLAWVRPNQAAGLWTVEIHFLLQPVRPDFRYRRYEVQVPFAEAELRKQSSIENGYRVSGRLHLAGGKIVIDDPVSRAKPQRTIEFIPSMNGSEPHRAVP